ncbi:hypothetical protein T12_17043 [Trichinella patagoniensis]|uniref:Uncharacterized protein n=1 Tax=Trichinella patagoniensis TaxID=990121 RepID=A0A0V0Z3T4_9BILA|nr:hypothetical protein T12_16543 [Trichinella patagoniensis]KRY07186.1 hypothetical protein T12_17043 [Trichinella patagoniensis]
MTSLPARIISSLTPLWIRRYFIEGPPRASVLTNRPFALLSRKQCLLLDKNLVLRVQFTQRNKQAVSLSGLLWCNTSIGIPNQDQLSVQRFH